LRFDGADDYVTIPHHDTLEPPAASGRSITIEAWINPESFGNLDGIVSKYQEPADASYTLRLSGTDGNVEVQINHNGAAVELVSDTEVGLDEWTHVAAVYDDDTGWLRIYINGVLDKEENVGPGMLAINGSVVTIGVDYLNSPRYFEGSIDEVRIWNVARTEAQIADHMNSRLSGTEQGLMGYWPMDEGSGTTVNDQSVNTNHGTIVGNPTWVGGAF